MRACVGKAKLGSIRSGKVRRTLGPGGGSVRLGKSSTGRERTLARFYGVDRLGVSGGRHECISLS